MSTEFKYFGKFTKGHQQYENSILHKLQDIQIYLGYFHSYIKEVIKGEEEKEDMDIIIYHTCCILFKVIDIINETRLRELHSKEISDDMIELGNIIKKKSKDLHRLKEITVSLMALFNPLIDEYLILEKDTSYIEIAKARIFMYKNQ